MSWVAPYAIAETKTRLKDTYTGGVGPRNSLTHLALQFWKPTATGGLVRSTQFGSISNPTINSFVDWGHRFGIKVMLCVYNGDVAPGEGVVNGWDWSLVQAAIKPEKQTKFINALIAEMTARGLDGIDIDLEGPQDQHDADKANYVALIKALGKRVHKLNKTLTVDTFPAEWNAPNWNWWPELFPHVDAINSMGYEELGRKGIGWARYANQKSHADTNARKLNIGIPSYKGAWLGNTTLEQVQWFKAASAGRVGIAIWDARFTDASWKSNPVWNVLKSLRQPP